MPKSMKGFTLIELLIVIVIIGILSTGAVALFTNAQRNARDAARQQDLTQLATAINVYATENNSTVPAATSLATFFGDADPATLPNGLVDGGYLQKAIFSQRSGNNDGAAAASEEVYCYYTSTTPGVFGLAALLESGEVFTAGNLSALTFAAGDFYNTNTVPTCPAVANASPTMTAVLAFGV